MNLAQLPLESGSAGAPADRQRLTALRSELRINRAALKQVRDWYGVFAFTGGTLPCGPFQLKSTADYLQRPFAAQRVSTGNVARYRELVAAISPPAEHAQAGPRTVRCRRDLADAFARTSSQLETLGDQLESSLTGLLDEFDPAIIRASQPNADSQGATP